MPYFQADASFRVDLYELSRASTRGSLGGMRWHFIVFLTITSFFFPSFCAADESVAITSVGDFNLGTWNGHSDLEAQDTVCIYRLGDPDYQITATGSGTGGAFSLVNGGNTISYDFYFRDSGSFVKLTSGTPEPFTGADTAHDNCQGVNNAEMKVVATQAALGGVPPGNYSGVLTLLLEPR